MGFIKYLAIGAAVAAGVNYITKKRPDGRSLVDDIQDRAPEWIDKAKQYGQQVKDQVSNATANQTGGNNV